MVEKPLNQSSPRRAWIDTTESFHKIWFFWSVEVIAFGVFVFLGNVATPEGAGAVVSAAYPVVGGVIGAIVGLGIIYLICLIKAPYKQRDEARNRVYVLEDERTPRMKVLPIAGRRQYEHEHEHLMWAELQVTNTSPSIPLEDIEVRIISCIYVQPKQDKPNTYVFVDLHDWNPTSIYWSIRDASPNQLSLSVSPNATKTALVAFQDNSNGVQSVFNAPTHPIIVGGAKIEVEISSHNSAIWKGGFYLECTPNWFQGPQATFDFVAWEDWEANHDIVPLSHDN